MLHTTREHPFFTIEQGFVPAGKLHPGMHVLQADGRVGVVTGWKLVAGTKLMYNLEVAQDHTFAVGVGQWVVHNECDSRSLRRNMINDGVAFSQGQDAHHVIPCDFASHPLIAIAKSDEGKSFDMNASYNGRAMWDNAYYASIYNQAYHSGNHPNYSDLVGRELSSAYAELDFNANFGPIEPVDAYNALMGIIDQMNTFIDDLGRGEPGCLLS